MSALLARPEIAALKAYSAAVQLRDTTRLNANEVPWNPGELLENSSVRHSLNRYPQIRPWELRRRLAEVYSVLPEQLLVTRGSSEAIDLLLRAFCIPSEDNIIITPPTFGMYRVYADIQQASVVPVPLRAEDDFSLDTGALITRADNRTKLIFLCSPNNPTGNTLAVSDVEAILKARHGRSVLVIDEAYIEFGNSSSVIQLLADNENLVVLRTLSKAHGLAAARVGSVIASPAIVNLLDSILAPYAVSEPVVDFALRALAVDGLARTESRIQQLLLERRRVVEALHACASVERVWESDANFVLVRFHNLELVLESLARRRILIRDFSTEPGLQHCARVTIGSAAENDRLLDTLRALEAS